MNWTLLVPLTLLPLASFADTWKISKQTTPYAYSVNIPIQNEAGDQIACVQRVGFLTPRYYYDLYDEAGEMQARGITRFLSLGMFYEWALEVDVYDEDDAYIGLIQGKWFTNSRASFVFYDDRERCQGNAYLHDKKTQFVLTGNERSPTPFAELQGKTFGDSALWEVTLPEKGSPVDSRILQIFCGLVCDCQQAFVYRPKEVHYHYHDERPKMKY